MLVYQSQRLVPHALVLGRRNVDEVKGVATIACEEGKAVTMRHHGLALEFAMLEVGMNRLDSFAVAVKKVDKGGTTTQCLNAHSPRAAKKVEDACLHDPIA